MRAAGTYDWPGVAAEIPALLKARISGHTWIPVDLLRPAGVIALARTGDRESARKLFDALDHYSNLEPSDLRVMLLRSIVAPRRAVWSQ